MNTHPKVFLLEPEQNEFDSFLVFADSEDEARTDAASHAISSCNGMLNNSPYLDPKTKCTEVTVTTLDESPSASNALHCSYNNKEYYLTKNHPAFL